MSEQQHDLEDSAAIQGLDQFQQNIEVGFRQPELLINALTHSSFAKRSRKKRIADNERLEFFGDAVLKLIVSEYLYHRYTNQNEGKLSRIRSRIISDRTLARIARAYDMGSFIRFSFGEQNTGGADRLSNLASAMEALLGAIYMDQGYETAKSFFIRALKAHTPDLLTEKGSYDAKTCLQEWLQKKQLPLPVYTVVDQIGPEHESEFVIEVVVNTGKENVTAVGKGRNKKNAQQKAAQAAVEALGLAV